MATTYRFFGFDYPPFADTADPQFLYPSAGICEAWSCLVEHLRNGRDVILLVGEPGTGKTLLYRYLLEKLWRHIPISLITNPHMQPVELLATVCDDFGIRHSLEQPEEHLLLKHLSDFLAGARMRSGRAMLIVDEAHNLTPKALETLCWINKLAKAADNTLRILLVGQQDMVETVRGTLIQENNSHPDLAMCSMHPLSKGETIAYIRHRLRVAGGDSNLFTRGAALSAYRTSRGIPRVVNILCDHALRDAQAQSRKTVTSRQVRASARKSLTGEKDGASWSRLAALPGELMGTVLETIRQPFSGARDSAGDLAPSELWTDDGYPEDHPENRDREDSQGSTAHDSMGKQEMPPPVDSPAQESPTPSADHTPPPTASESATVQDPLPPAESARAGKQASPSKSAKAPPASSPQTPDPGTKRSDADSRKARSVPSAPPEMVFIDSMELHSAYTERTIPVREFFLDRTPVTNAAYSRFVEATDHPPPYYWVGTKPPPRLHHHPVVSVSLEDARRFAQWCGKRLPTVLEWECAARHPDHRRFPWGNEWDADRCNNPESGPGDLTAVDAYPEGSSADGCLDLVGNAWEWTELPERSEADRDDPEPGSLWVMGGSFRHPCRVEGHMPRTAVSATHRYRFLGFRCAREII